jgi:integrase
MMEAEADMKFIQEQLGHESKKITKEVYAHISKKLEQRNMERFENYTKEILK